jgi:hypothetical protein
MVWRLAPLLVSLLGCGGGTPRTADVSPAAIAVLPAERLAVAWPVRYAKVEELGPVSGDGWTADVVRHDLAASVAANGPAGGAATMRAHADAAALFRMGALLEANALIQTYGVTPEETDPLGVAHLLTVSYAITGDLAHAREWSAKLDGTTDATAAWHAPWKAWLTADAPGWPPDLSALPVVTEAPAPGGWPDVGTLPHYALPERGGGGHDREMGDPGALVRLALWHEAAARAASPGDAAALAAWLAPYRLPAEPMDPPAPATDALLFGSELLVPEDAAFLADIRRTGAGAIDTWRDRSLIAEIAVRSRGADGHIDPLVAADQISALRAALLEAAAARTDATVQGHQRTFADIASVGATRALGWVAEIEGNRETGGRLRIAAMERSQKETANPAGLLSLAAWDSANRYPVRAQEILHAQLGRFPALECARYGLDVLALRVSRERPGETPGM